MKKTIAIFTLAAISMGTTNAIYNPETQQGDRDTMKPVSEMQATQTPRITNTSIVDRMSPEERMESMNERMGKMKKRAEEIKEQAQERNEKMRKNAENRRDELMKMPKEKMKKFRTNLKEARYTKNETILANKDEMKNNRKEFRDENGEMKKVFGELSDDVRGSLRDLHEAFKTESDEIRKLLKENYSDDDLRKEYLTQLEKLRKGLYDDTIVLIGDNTEAIDLLNARKDVVLENDKLRKQNAKVRIEYRGEISDLVTNQKVKLLDRIQTGLDKMSDIKLERILVQLEKINKRFEKAKISDEKKQEIEAKIIALKEIVEEKLEANISEEEELNIEELLNLN